MKKHKLRSNPSRLADAKERIADSASWRKDKPTSNSRGYTYEWQCARDEWLSLHSLCVMCERKSRVVQATVVDHIKPHNGNMVLFWNRDNWQSLCSTCHSKHKQRLERASLR